ncbi:hypothetical protein [Streptomyces sp. 4F14]|uniref:hypothetical protein n=1 Tax=Streptomyces sp. 4F14 TaxID=3394380 RepID=UPI003A83DEC2
MTSSLGEGGGGRIRGGRGCAERVPGRRQDLPATEDSPKKPPFTVDEPPAYCQQ